ncbi:hypothetical protein AURDEDRAFT_165626 [Auricularia subglabra TFB-10046 SS5]|nr:hypothetical protein AURDEDRAFT_165626 [Auricularia subglabra TFB-10046 SS5]
MFSGQSSDVRRRQLQPFRLAAVCRHWREASLSYAPSWNTLDLRLDEVTDANASDWQLYTTTVLRNSAQVPLYIRLFRERPTVTATDNALVDTLRPIMVRCAALSLSVHIIGDEVDYLSLLLRCPTPLLHAFQLMLGRDAKPRPPLDILPDAPKLRRLFSTHPIGDGRRRFPAAEEVILDTPISAETERRDDIRLLQQACPALGKLRMISPRIASQFCLEPCVLTVRTLRITYFKNGDDLIEFARQFAFPRIRTLNLDGDPVGSGPRMRFLRVVAALPQWKKLVVLVVVIAADDMDVLCDALAAAAELSRLAIWWSAFTPASLRRLCIALDKPLETGNAWACPALETLELQCCTFDPETLNDGCLHEAPAFKATHYPYVLSQPCYQGGTHDKKFPKGRPWVPDEIALSELDVSIISDIVLACGPDPATATREDMDSPDARLVCKPCLEKNLLEADGASNCLRCPVDRPFSRHAPWRARSQPLRPSPPLPAEIYVNHLEDPVYIWKLRKAGLQQYFATRELDNLSFDKLTKVFGKDPVVIS